MVLVGGVLCAEDCPDGFDLDLTWIGGFVWVV